MSALTDKLRVLVNEAPEVSDFSDNDLGTVLTEYAGDLNRAAAQVWRIKAGRYADLVSMSEGNSNRQWSGAYKQALEMAEMYDAIADGDGGAGSSGTNTARTRRIVRS